MNRKWLISWVLIIVLAVFLRFNNFLTRAPFDWDQNRDYSKVAGIVGGKFTMLGPIAKGDNGFYLGPLYYYLLVPGYILSSGNPTAFPATSIILDLLFISSILYLASRRPGSRLMLTATAIIWAVSWFAIENSKISWNVSLLPLWVIWMYAFGTMRVGSIKRLFIYGLLAGLSWHVHASLLPLSLILPVLFIPKTLSRIQSYFAIGAGYLIALLPLIAFDVRHTFFNFRLMTNFGNTQLGLVHPPISVISNDVILKLGKNTLSLFTGNGKSFALIGIAVILVSLWAIVTRRRLLLWPGLVIILNFLFVIGLFDLRFPEYYLAAAALPIMLIILSLLAKNKFVVAIFTMICVVLNLSVFTTVPTAFGLAQKINVVNAISDLGQPVDVRYELSPGREGGIMPLLNRAKVKVIESSPTKIVFTEKMDGPVIVGGELTEDLIRSGGLRVSIFRVR